MVTDEELYDFEDDRDEGLSWEELCEALSGCAGALDDTDPNYG